ncbi:MAG TPA: hypothetical protein VGW78_07720 [Candidatus Babeliales bacterium]|jgi:hypothetical protein|nr:hypothetical protein [Candidatus Babeliales bacterium]
MQKSRYQIAIIDEINLANTAVTFAAGATTSSVFPCAGVMPSSLFIPSGWTTGNVSFQVCKTVNGTFLPLAYFDGTAYSISSVAASQCIPLIPALFHSQLYLQLVCSVAQVSAVTVDMGLVPLYQGLHS